MENRIAVTVIPTDELFSLLPEWGISVIQQWLPPGLGGELQIYSEIQNGWIIQHFDLVDAAGGINATGEMPELMRYITRGGISLVARGALLAGGHEGMFPNFLATGDHRLLSRPEAAWLLNVEQAIVDQLRAAPLENRRDLFASLVPSNHCQDIYNEAIRTVNLL